MFGIMQQIRQASKLAATQEPIRRDLNSLKLFVRNLPWTIGKTELTQHFTQYGPISKADVVFNMETGISRGYGFVSFQYSHSYVKALGTKYHMLEGHLLEIEPVKIAQAQDLSETI